MEESSSQKEQKQNLFDSKFRFWSLIFFLIALSICAFPIIFTLSAWCGIDFTKTGQIGDTIGGTMTPFVAILAAYFTFIAFWMQFKANEITIANLEDQRHNFNRQQDITNVQRFESKFYEMIKLHRDNVEELEGKRKYFFYAFNNLRLIYHLIKEHLYELSDEDLLKYNIQRQDDEKALLISYLIYWFGADLNSLKEFIVKMTSEDFLEYISVMLSQFKEDIALHEAERHLLIAHYKNKDLN